MKKTEEVKMIDAIMSNDNVKAMQQLEKILKRKCAKKIAKVLKNNNQ